MHSLVHRPVSSNSPPQDSVTTTGPTQIEEEALATRASAEQENIIGKLRELFSGQSFERPKFIEDAPNFKESVKEALILNCSWWNVLLIFVPPCYFSGVNHLAVFFLSFLAIIPLPTIYAIAAEEILKRMGSLGRVPGVMWSIHRHIAKLIIRAIEKCKPEVAQSSLIGSIISNLLIILGMSIFLGGLRYSEQGLGRIPTQTYSSLMMVMLASLLPTAYYKSINLVATSNVTNTKIRPQILPISHCIVMVQLFVYLCFQIFRRFTHSREWWKKDPRIAREHALWRRCLSRKWTSATVPESSPPDDKPKMCLSAAIVLFVPTFFAMYFVGGAIVTSIDDFASTIHVTTEFSSLIILPLSDNLQDKTSALKASFQNNAIEAVDLAVGSSIETALLIFPVTVVGSWIFRKPLLLLFDTFEGVVLFFSILATNYVIKDEKSNWLEGMVLMCIYAIFALTFWFYPGSGSDLANKVISCLP